MKVNELRVCNCIEDWTDVKNGPIQRQIDLDDFAMMANYERSENHPLPFKPIPLTEEWLLKMGFKSNPYNDTYYLNNVIINCDKTRGFTDLWIDDFPHIKFVHQMQNFYFTITGEELEVKL